MKTARALLLMSVMFTITFPLASQSLKVMTYNIRLATESDGINAWSKRKERVFALLQKYSPDLIGVQEAFDHQLSDIITALPEYAYVGVGRDDGKNGGEFSALIYKKSKYKVEEENTFWLSEKPNEPGSKGWDAAYPRVVTWARLKDLETGKSFLAVNTHFDHVGKEARLNSATIIKDRIQELAAGLPVIVTGDFNHERSEPPYQIMTRKDKVQLIDPAPKDPPGTFCNFGVNAEKCIAIDYIYHSTHWRSKNYTIIRDNDGANYPSDHLPVTLEVTAKK